MGQAGRKLHHLMHHLPQREKRTLFRSFLSGDKRKLLLHQKRFLLFEHLKEYFEGSAHRWLRAAQRSRANFSSRHGNAQLLSAHASRPAPEQSLAPIRIASHQRTEVPRLAAIVLVRIADPSIGFGGHLNRACLHLDFPP